MRREINAPLHAIACGVMTDALGLPSDEEAIDVAVTEVDSTEGRDGIENIGEADLRFTWSSMTSNAQVSMDLKWYLKDTRAMSISLLSRGRSICGLVTCDSSCGLLCTLLRRAVNIHDCTDKCNGHTEHTKPIGSF